MHALLTSILLLSGTGHAIEAASIGKISDGDDIMRLVVNDIPGAMGGFDLAVSFDGEETIHTAFCVPNISTSQLDCDSGVGLLDVVVEVAEGHTFLLVDIAELLEEYPGIDDGGSASPMVAWVPQYDWLGHLTGYECETTDDDKQQCKDYVAARGLNCSTVIPDAVQYGDTCRLECICQAGSGEVRVQTSEIVGRPAGNVIGDPI